MGYLVGISSKYNLKLIHFSTDYVFDGKVNYPYTEEMAVCPLGIYGKTKRAGEVEIIDSCSDSIVIRTSWLYSSYGNNFVKTILRLGKEKEELSVVSDQIGTPTYARDLAKVCLSILNKPGRLDSKGKVYHYSNEGIASWYDFAHSIMELSEVDCQLKAIESKDYSRSAERPHYSVLNKSKLKSDFGVNIPHWRDSLLKCITRIKK